MDVIGDDGWGGGISEGNVQTFLNDNRTKPVSIKINSLGGSFYSGLSIFNQLLDHPKPVTATVTGIAFSAASLIAMGADRLIMNEASDFGIHKAWTFTLGNADELTAAAEWLNSVDAHGITVYQAKSGASRQQVVDWLTGSGDGMGTKFSATEALAAGFCDEVIPIKKPEPESKFNSSHAKLAAEIQQKRIKARLGR